MGHINIIVVLILLGLAGFTYFLFKFLIKKDQLLKLRVKECDQQKARCDKMVMKLMDDGIVSRIRVVGQVDGFYLGDVVARFLHGIPWKIYNRFDINIDKNIPKGYYAKIRITIDYHKEIEILVDDDWMENLDDEFETSTKHQLTQLGQLLLQNEILKKIQQNS